MPCPYMDIMGEACLAPTPSWARHTSPLRHHRRGMPRPYPDHFRLNTRTFRKRAGAAPWPVCASCEGCPLPQFGVPQITQ